MTTNPKRGKEFSCLEDILDNPANSFSINPFGDDLSEKRSPLWMVMEANGILTSDLINYESSSN